jgi:hypothetical protein
MKKLQEQPLSLRPKKVVMDKLRKVSEVNGLPISTIGNMCLAAGIFIVESKLGDIRDPHTAKQPA